MKRLLLFAGDNFYPGGGWLDFKQSADHAWELKGWYANLKCDWGMIVRASDGCILEGTGTIHYMFKPKNGVWRPYVEQNKEDES